MSQFVPDQAQEDAEDKDNEKVSDCAFPNESGTSGKTAFVEKRERNTIRSKTVSAGAKAREVKAICDAQRKCREEQTDAEPFDCRLSRKFCVLMR